MKILLDICVWGLAKSQLAGKGSDVVWAGDWPHDPGDAKILEIAHQANRGLVPLDKDFGELAIVRERPHKGIIRDNSVG